MLHLISLLLLTSAVTRPLSVTSCGADSTGKVDSTSAFETCLASLPAGDLSVPYGTYRISRPIFKSRSQNIVGMGSRASILKCELKSGPCIVAADTSGGPNNYAFSEIQNLSIEGPGAAIQSIGVLLGGDPDGRLIPKTAFGDAVSFTDVRITGFGHGIQWGNNAWGNKFLHCALFQNTVGIFVPKGLNNSGEAISISDSNIFNNSEAGIEDHTGFEWFIQGTSFDYNTVAFIFLGATIHASNCHFEQQSSRIFFQPYGMGTLSIRDSTILSQAATGAEKYILDVWPQALTLTIDDVSIWSNHPVQYLLHAQGVIAGSVNNLHGNGNRKIGTLSEKPTNLTLSNVKAF